MFQQDFPTVCVRSIKTIKWTDIKKHPTCYMWSGGRHDDAKEIHPTVASDLYKLRRSARWYLPVLNIFIDSKRQ